MAKHSYLGWLDLEMTGLDLEHDVIIEIATVVTDGNLEIVAEGPCLALQCAPTILANMDEWNQKHHNESGLVERVMQSEVSTAQAEEQTLDFLCRYLEKNESPLCGNSVCTDRQFLLKHMPELATFFHYRHLDVSSFKEVFKRWLPAEKRLYKKSQHLALSDIYDSIDEMRFYKQYITD